MKIRFLVYGLVALCLGGALVAALYFQQRMATKVDYKEVVESIPESFRNDLKIELGDERGVLNLLFAAERQAEKDAGGLAVDTRALTWWDLSSTPRQRPEPGEHKIYFDKQLIVELHLDQDGRSDGYIKKYYLNGRLHWAYYYDAGMVAGISKVYHNNGFLHREIDWGEQPKERGRAASATPKSIKIFNNQGQKIFESVFGLGIQSFNKNIDYSGAGNATVDTHRLFYEGECRMRMRALAGDRLVYGDQDLPAPGLHKILLDDKLWYELNYNTSGLLDGTVKEYYLSGAPHRIYNFVNGVEQDARSYYENGFLESYSKENMVVFYDKTGRFIGGQGNISPRESKKHEKERIEQ